MKYLAGRPWIAFAAVFAGSFSVAGCGGESAPTEDEVLVTTTHAPDGPALYQAQCAMCHGVHGDGDGIVVLDRPARSFKKGAFSFGNTPEALFRTIANGIGGTPMPGFKGSLSEAECRLLADYVIELGPELIPVVPGQSEYRVLDKPLVIRGSLPPIADGLAPVTRGLLVGGTDGLTFEFNTKPMVLLGVRQGDFVDRKDWGGRGGASLQPLGVVSHLVQGGTASHSWLAQGGQDAWKPVHARFLATNILRGEAWVEYSLQGWDPSKTGQAFVILENGQAISLAGWSGFRRTFRVVDPAGFQGLRLAQLDGDGIVEVATGPKGTVWSDTSGGAQPVIFLQHPTVKDDQGYLLHVDILFGLPATEENLKGLKEMIQ